MTAHEQIDIRFELGCAANMALCYNCEHVRVHGRGRNVFETCDKTKRVVNMYGGRGRNVFETCDKTKRVVNMYGDGGNCSSFRFSRKAIERGGE